MIPRFLSLQGAIGLSVSLVLGLLLLIQVGEARHWRKQSAGFEQLYRGEVGAHAQSVANFRAAADAARAADRVNAERVAAAQRTINERTANDFEARLSDARARSERLRGQGAVAASDSRGRRDAPVSGLSLAPGAITEPAGADRFSSTDALIATEQAIQLDELIKWVRQQHAIRVNGGSGARP